MDIAGLLRFPWWRRERRGHPRLHAPGLVLIAEWKRFEARDWSLGGCLIDAPPGTYTRGQRIEGTLEIRGQDERGEFLAEIVRVNEGGELGLRWLEISGNLFALMATIKG